MSRPRVAVAVSGGRDSTALLHCTARQAGALGVQVTALHVHHALQPQADAWMKQVAQQARRWGAEFACQRLSTSPTRGESVEAWARQQRYRALAEMARQARCELVLLAHHRRDQAETWLLQALRGAGAAGLAGMPGLARRDGITWARPWLAHSGDTIADYVRRHRLGFAVDPSNADPRYARSRLRLSVWPALVGAFADAETTVAAAASRSQDALALAQEAAEADLSVLAESRGLNLARWQQLPPARRKNAMQAWLTRSTGHSQAQTLVTRLMLELSPASQGSWPASGATLRLYRGWLNAEVVLPVVEAAVLEPTWLDLSREGEVGLPAWGGHWQVQAAREGGVATAILGRVLAHARIGGERFRLAKGGLARSLKLQFQARAVPAWQRRGPLLSTPQGQLVFVPGLGPEATFAAAPGQAQMCLQWVPDAASPTGRRQRGS